MITPTARYLDCTDPAACADAGFDPDAAGDPEAYRGPRSMLLPPLAPPEEKAAGPRAMAWVIAALAIVGCALIWWLA